MNIHPCWGSHSARETGEPLGADAKIQALDTKDACLVDVSLSCFLLPVNIQALWDEIPANHSWQT